MSDNGWMERRRMWEGSGLHCTYVLAGDDFCGEEDHPSLPHGQITHTLLSDVFQTWWIGWDIFQDKRVYVNKREGGGEGGVSG